MRRTHLGTPNSERETRTSKRMIKRRAPAKINLGLHVLRKRPDGYHDIETVFYRIGWADTITVARAEMLSLTCSDPALPTGADNLCMQAAQRLAAAFDVTQGAQIHLDKRVPIGAGLGGGSSDAAATLQALAELWDLSVSPDEVHALATRIGSDVPFFLLDAPAACATGRGDVLTPLTVDGTLFRLEHPMLVVVPPVSVATPEAYQRVTPRAAGRLSVCDVVASGGLERWRHALQNDFEKPITDAYAPVADARSLLREHDAAYVSLSGSGAAVYGMFTTAEQMQTASAAAERAGFRVFEAAPESDADTGPRSP